MAISLFAAQAEGGHLISLDDQAVVKDLAAANGTGGNAYSPTLLSGPIAPNTIGRYATLRRLLQRITHSGATTITVTSWREGLDTGQTITRTLTTLSRPLLTVPLRAVGSVFQFRLTISGFDAAVALGSAEFTLIERRSGPGGSPVVGSESA